MLLCSPMYYLKACQNCRRSWALHPWPYPTSRPESPAPA